MIVSRVPPELWNEVALRASKIDALALSDALDGICELGLPDPIIEAPYTAPVLPGLVVLDRAMIPQLRWATLVSPDLTMDQYEWLHTRLPGALTHTQLELGGALSVLKVLQRTGYYRREMARPDALDRASHRGHLPLFKWLAGPRYHSNPSDMAYAFVSRNRALITWMWGNLLWGYNGNVMDNEIIACGLGMSADIELIREYAPQLCIFPEHYHNGLITGLVAPCYPERAPEALRILRTLYIDHPCGNLGSGETDALNSALFLGGVLMKQPDILYGLPIPPSGIRVAAYAIAGIFRDIEALQVLSSKGIPDCSHALIGAVANAALYPDDKSASAFVQFLLDEKYPLGEGLWSVAVFWSARTKGSAQSRALLSQLFEKGPRVTARVWDAAAYGGDVGTMRSLVVDFKVPRHTTGFVRLLLLGVLSDTTEDRKLELLTYIYDNLSRTFTDSPTMEKTVLQRREYGVFRWLMGHKAIPFDLRNMIVTAPVALIAEVINMEALDQKIPFLIACSRYGRSDIAAHFMGTLSPQPLQNFQLARLALPAIVYGHLHFLEWLETLVAPPEASGFTQPEALGFTISVETQHRSTREWALRHGYLPTFGKPPWRIDVSTVNITRIHNKTTGESSTGSIGVTPAHRTFSSDTLATWGGITREPLSDDQTLAVHRFNCERNAEAQDAFRIIRVFH